MISRRLPASSSFVLAAARLRALQPDPRPAARILGQLRGRIQKNSQPSPAARVVTGPGPYALLTLVALMGAAEGAGWHGGSRLMAPSGPAACGLDAAAQPSACPAGVSGLSTSNSLPSG